MNYNNLISIIIPSYNSEKFIKDTIDTIKNQTYQNFEAIFVDDCSTDNSAKIIEDAGKLDKRIKLIRNENNLGAGLSRNAGIEQANGRFICLLDADDLWDKDKLKSQVEFMEKHDCEFSFTGYEFADEKGNPNGKKVYVPDTITYKQALKNTTIWTSTVMFDMSKLSKEDIFMPDIRRGQDTATWWKVLKKIDKAYGLNEVLSFYRRTNNTLSSNKLVALKRTWHLHRNVEHLNLFYCLYNFFWYCINAVKRRI